MKTVYQRIKADIQEFIDNSKGPEALRNLYRNQTRTKLVWDIFGSTRNYAENACDLFALDCDDEYVEFLLVQICTELELIITPKEPTP